MTAALALWVAFRNKAWWCSSWGLRVPLFGSDGSVKSVINYSISVDSVCSVDYLFHTDGHGWMSASGRGGYCLSSKLRRYLDGGPQADCFGERELPWMPVNWRELVRSYVVLETNHEAVCKIYEVGLHHHMRWFVIRNKITTHMNEKTITCWA